MARVADAIARTLAAYGTEYFFCLTGGDHALWIALDDVGIEVIVCRSEHAAVYAADGYARASGRPGFVYGQYGPGVANVVAGLADPYWAMSPVISLTTATRSSSVGRYEYQELEQLPLHTAVTKWSQAISRPDQAAPFLRTAIRVATSTPAGPVHLEVPADLLSAPYEIDDADIYAEPAFGRVPGLRTAPPPGAAAAVADALATAERPVVLAGNGVVLSEAWGELTDLAEGADLPVVTSMGGKGAIAETHPRAVGLVGRYSRKVANDVLGEADLVLVVGCRLGGMVTNSWRLPPPGTRIVHVDADPTVLGTTYREELSVVGDARLTLRAVADELARRPPSPAHQQWAAAVEARVEAWRGHVAQSTATAADTAGAGAVPPAAVMATLRELLAPTDVLVADTGYMGAWTGALYPVTAPGRHFVRAAGSLGWAVPAALGVALARPGARVACVTGDGGVGYHLMELETALRCGIDVTIVVLNNVSMAFETHGQRLQWDNRVLPKVNDFLDVDYAAVARSLGAQGARVDEVGALKGALQDALSSGIPSLVDVRIDKEAIAPVTNFEGILDRDV